jgi:ABC-type proline/glycine betaine transport system permease subunit
MDSLGRSGAHAATNTRARAAFIAGLIAAIAIPVGLCWAAWTYHTQGTPQLFESYAAIPVAVLLGLLAVFLGRGGMRTAWITLGRVGGARLARGGWVLGIVGVYFGVMALLAISFYGILLLFQ